MLSGGRRRTLALTFLCVLVVLVPAAVVARPLQNPDYTGHGRFDRQVRVAFKVGRSEAGQQRVTFAASNVKQICDDGTSRVDFNPVRARLNKRDEFERVVYFGDEADPVMDQEFYWVKGKLLPERRAKGFIFSMFDPWDPPGSANAAECSTFGRVRWTAAQVR